jgi:hypothetical protein
VILALKRFLLAAALALLILTALALPADGQHKNEATSLPFSATPYSMGERLTYNVSFSSFVSAAHIELLVAGRGTFFGHDAIQLKGHVETKGVVYAALYALNNDYATYIDAATGLPFRFEQVVREGARGSSAAIELNQPGSVNPDLSGTYDVLAALYRLRALPLTDGTVYPITVRSDLAAYQAELIVKGHETVKTNVGSFNVIASQLRVAGNSAINEYKIQIFFTDDERHVPVLVTANLSSGQLRAELASTQILPVGPLKPPPGMPTPTPTPVPNPTPRPRATPTPGPLARPDNFMNSLPFKAGEQLNYRVYLASVQQPVGLVSFQVRNRSRYFDHDGLMFTTTAQTTEAALRLFVANDQFTTYVDPQTLLPYRSELNLVEGRRRANEIWTINQEYGSASKQGTSKVDIPIGTHDYLSLFYAVRSMNLAAGKQNALSVLVNGRPKTLIITAFRRETIVLDNQKISAIQLKLTTPEDPQPDKFQLRAWISDDDRRLPLRLTATTELGALRADLSILSVTSQ